MKPVSSARHPLVLFSRLRPGPALRPAYEISRSPSAGLCETRACGETDFGDLTRTQPVFPQLDSSKAPDSATLLSLAREEPRLDSRRLQWPEPHALGRLGCLLHPREDQHSCFFLPNWLVTRIGIRTDYGRGRTSSPPFHDYISRADTRMASDPRVLGTQLGLVRDHVPFFTPRHRLIDCVQRLAKLLQPPPPPRVLLSFGSARCEAQEESAHLSEIRPQCESERQVRESEPGHRLSCPGSLRRRGLLGLAVVAVPARCRRHKAGPTYCNRMPRGQPKIKIQCLCQNRRRKPHG